MAKRTYYPPKTFDDDLANFVALYKAKQWSFSGIDGAALLQDAGRQREERIEHDALEIEYQRVHEEFGIAQEKR